MNSNEAKVNWGTLAEIPEICVDRFGSLKTSDVNWETTRAFFLTHYDEEICEDVLSKDFLDTLADPASNYHLYLHKLAFEYLKYWTTTIYVEDGEEVSSVLDKLRTDGKIVFLETDRPVRLDFQTQDQKDVFVDVTALSSGFNIGCVMYLFERLGEDETRVLFTGDCRLTVKDLEQMSTLHNSDGSVKKIDKLYLDTTFCIEDAKELPSRRQVTDQLLTSISYYVEADSNLHFDILTPSKVCNVAFLQKLAERLENGIHVPSSLATFLQHVPELKNLVQWKSGSGDRVHYDCGDSCDNELCGNGELWGVDFDIFTVNVACDFPYHHEFPASTTSREDEKQWCKYQNAVYPTSDMNLRGIYSSNLSRFEMGRLINFFNIELEEILPLHKSPEMGSEEFLILLEIGCADAKVEPLDLQQELPSYCYDFTSTSSPNEL